MVFIILTTFHISSSLINGRDTWGWTGLDRAAIFPRGACLKVLLEKGADVNAVNKGGVTALHRAAMWGNTEAASMLIAAGANARLHTKPSPYAPQGETPEQAAVRDGHHDLAALLRLAGQWR